MKQLLNIKKESFLILLLSILISSCINRKDNYEQKISLKENQLYSIGISKKASEREEFAAKELADYLYKISGKMLSIVKINNSKVPKGMLAVGNLSVESGIITREELNNVARDGFIIKIEGDKGAICGWRDLGTIYGVYELLKKTGVRFYAKNCEVIPNQPDLVLPELNILVKPHFDIRAIFKLDVYFPGFKPDVKLGYTPNDDMGYPGDLGAPEERNWVHSSSFLMPYRKFGKDHPEYFALQKNGKRYKPGDGPPGHLCLSNENMRKAGAERLLWLIEQQKERSYFVVTQGDGRSQWWCQCPNCQALDAEPGVHMTDRLLEYVNYNAREVAKKFPDKKILTLAYTEATARPPKRVLPDSNVMVMYCPYPPQTMCQSHGLDCPKNKRAKEELEGWISLCPDNMYIFDYPRGYAAWYEPFGSFYAMADKINYYSEIGIRGIIYCVIPTNFRDLFIFVQSKLHWDTEADVEKLIDEFMEAYYGPAAQHIREYFNFMHKEIDIRQLHQMCEARNPELVTAEFADKALEMFDKAQAAVSNDSVYLGRVESEKFCVLWPDINQRNTVNNNLTVSLSEHAKRFGEMVRIAKDMKIVIVQRGELGNFKNWARSVAPLWLQSEPWYNDPGVEVLIKKPINLFTH